MNPYVMEKLYEAAERMLLVGIDLHQAEELTRLAMCKVAVARHRTASEAARVLGVHRNTVSKVDYPRKKRRTA